jgi:hypothetical protein
MATAVSPAKAGEIVEAVIARGDLSKLTADERARYYVRTCESLGLNPLTKPFAYMYLKPTESRPAELVLYAKRDAADQLRKLHGISIEVVSQSEADGLYSVHVRAVDRDGRRDEDLGIVSLPESLKGEARANTILKAITKAKRRVTLSISGLGFLDETEIADIPASAKAPPSNVVKILKKDHRADYERLLAELNAQPSVEMLGEWREATAERVARLPADWQFRLSAQFEAALKYLRGESDVPPEEFQGTQFGEHIGASMARVAAQRPNVADDGIPDFLRRAPVAPKACGPDDIDESHWAALMNGAVQ